jgi:putative flavoprotein involved in K+ transport
MYDVGVIGGGQAGLAAGYHLKQSGLNFAILEAGNEPCTGFPESSIRQVKRLRL